MFLLLPTEINYKNSSTQIFSLPTPMILYIFEKSKNGVQQKFLQSCKKFKLLQKRGFFVRITMSSAQRIFDIGIHHRGFQIPLVGFQIPYKMFVDLDRELIDKIFIDIEMESIEIEDALVLSEIPKDKFDSIMPKLDLSNTRKIHLYLNFEINEAFLEKILQPHVEKLFLSAGLTSYKGVSLPAMAFDRCPKLIHIRIFVLSVSQDVLTKDVMKHLLQKKKEPKLKICSFCDVSDIDPEDLLKFMDNYCESICLLQLGFQDNAMQDFLRMAQFIRATTKRRRNENQPITCCAFSCGMHRSYRNY